ncbi:MAG: glycosyltransferase family 1 protein [Clostridiales bacterium]|nr:glycosyltransferase family 1 protein [Clostridiales bacterium]
MVRVLTILSGLDGGGVENILLNYYKKMNRNKVHIDFIVHSQHKGKLEDEFEYLGSNIYRVTPKTISFKRNTQEIYNVIKANKYDIVHTRMNVKGTTHMIIAWLCGIKVRMVHNHQAHMPIFGKTKYLIPLAKFLCKLFSTHWLACSEDAAIDMFGRNALKKGRVTILNNAIDAEKYDFDPYRRTIMRKEFNINNEYVIGMVGRFHDQKNHKFMIQILREIIKKDTNVKLMLVGGGELENQIYQMVYDYHLEDYVIFTGIRTDVPDLLQAMDIFVLPTKYEGFGNVLIESQAAGLKTITSLECVPKSTRLTDLIEYVPLSKSAEEWADIILSRKNEKPRKSQLKLIRQAGFDINTQAKNLENIYLYPKQYSKYNKL